MPSMVGDIIMARINIEDSLFRDDRWMRLLLICGDRYKALGIITSAWILAQENWISHKSIPKKAWSKDLDVLIDVELAETLENGDIYVKGSKNNFKWLEQRVNAGKLGGLSKRPLSDRLLPLEPAKPLTLTPSLTPRISQFSYLSEVVEEEQKPPPPVKKINSVERFDAAIKMSSDLEGKKFVDFFKEQSKLKTFERLLPEIFSHFGTFENFLLFYDGVLSSKAFLKDENHSRRMKYFAVALRKEIGVL